MAPRLKWRAPLHPFRSWGLTWGRGVFPYQKNPSPQCPKGTRGTVMTLRELPTSVMIVICDYFLKNCQALFAQYPLLSVLQSFIQDTRDVLVKSNAQLLDSQPLLSQWQETARNLDSRHDAFNRSLYSLLGASIDCTEDPQERQNLLSLRDTIFPLGLRINRLSWAAEAGESERLHVQLADPTLQQQLAAVRLIYNGREVDGLTLARAIVSVGHELGELLRKISHVQAESQVPASSTAPEVSEFDAQRKFLQMIRVLRENAQISLENNPEHHTLLWRVLDEQLARPSSRKKNDVPTQLQNPDQSNPVSNPQPTQPNVSVASAPSVPVALVLNVPVASAPTTPAGETNPTQPTETPKP